MKNNFNIVFKLGLATCLLLTASCASKKPHERGRGGPKRDSPRQGQLSSMGYVAQPLALLFASMDKSGDNQTSISELNTYTDAQWNTLNLKNDSGLRSFAYQKWATENLGHSDAMPSFIGFDTDLSGYITKLEFETCLRRNFDLLDKDKNGLISRTELLVKMPSMRDRGGQERKGRSGGGNGGGGGRQPR
ncbi:EF-hand domain-containing protein [Hirschia maritima]|uniref:EF-hand domain-containing protein n=1 Tax=Hirschia maritima TaxID=1121961 RepID=UPI0003782586|nr:hypothetical protein [Hirschia maritima]